MYSTIHKIALIDASHVPAVPLPHKDWPVPMRLGGKPCTLPCRGYAGTGLDTHCLLFGGVAGDVPDTVAQRVHGAGFMACSLVVGWREEGEGGTEAHRLVVIEDTY